jgi:tRNA (guanine37-N1)-methyltransferase
VRFKVITLFPELIEGWVKAGILGKALEAGTIQVSALSPREFTRDKYRTVDDAPYGGGSGMVMMPEPVAGAMDAYDAGAPADERAHRILLTPQGALFTQAHAARLAQKSGLMLVCGRYQGVDERIRSLVDEEISLGDFVLNGGEIAAIAVIEAVARLIPDVLGDADSRRDESHCEGLLQYPQYTRPRIYRGRQVPEVLLSGNHAEVAKWRRIQALKRTRRRRPDLFARYQLSEEERRQLDEDDRED